MKKKYKVRVFYNAWQDVEIRAEDEEELSDIIEELSTNNVNLQLDFYEELDDNKTPKWLGGFEIEEDKDE